MNIEHPRRVVRLRPRYAELYPTIPPGAWLPAAQWVDAIVTRAVEARSLNLHRRTFDPRHFEFRGGAPLAGAGSGISAPRRRPGAGRVRSASPPNAPAPGHVLAGTPAEVT